MIFATIEPPGYGSDVGLKEGLTAPFYFWAIRAATIAVVSPGGRTLPSRPCQPGLALLGNIEVGPSDLRKDGCRIDW